VRTDLKSAALMAKKKATQRPEKTTALSKPPKRKCGPPKGAVLHVTSVSGERGGRVVAAGMSRNTGKPPQPYKPHKIRKSTKINPQRMLITLPRTRQHQGQRIPTLSGASAWRDKIQQGIVTQKIKPQTLEATRRALLCMAPKHASAIANNLKYGRATYDHLFDRFKKANESETEVLRRHGREFYLPNRYFRKIDPEKWNGMMDEGKKLCRNQI
jgi:hypothetical protein